MARKVGVYTLGLALDSVVQGHFYLDSSLIDGPDGLYDGSSAQFGGTYTDVTDDVDGRLTARFGTDDLGAAIQAATLDFALTRATDPTYWNPGNPTSPVIAAHSPGFREMCPVKLTEVAEDSNGALTLSGNEVTDAVRGAGIQGDGATPPAGVGIWQSATNLCANGGAETDLTGWVDYGNRGATLTRVTSGAKFGAAAMQVQTTTAAGYMGAAYVLSGLTVGATYTASVWVHGPAGQTIYLYRDQSPQASVAIVLTGSWQLASLTFTAATAADQIEVVTGGTPVALTWLMDGVQVEAGPVATPYVETNGATAARGAARVQAPASLLSATQGWVAMRIRMGFPSSSVPGGGNAFPFIWNDGTNLHNDQYSIYIDATGEWNIRSWDSSAQSYITFTDAYSVGDLRTVIMAWDGTYLRASLDGAAFVSVAQTHMPRPAILSPMLDIGSNVAAQQVDSDVLWFAVGVGTLTDADAATINGFGDTPPDLADFPATAGCTAAMPMVDSSYQELATYGLYLGFIRTAQWDVETRSCRVHCEDAIYWLSREYPVISSTGPTTTGAAIGLILAAAGWADPTYRSLATGDSISDFSADGTQTALALIQALLDAERGTVYVDGSGVFHYEDRRSAASRSVSATFADQLTSASHGAGVQSGLDTDRIVNYCDVTRTGGVKQVAEDVTSEQNYGRGVLSISTPYLPDDQTALLLATDVVFGKKAPLSPATWIIENEDNATHLLQLTLGLLDAVTVDETLGDTNGTYTIDQIEHTIDAQGFTHVTTYLTRFRPAVVPFRIDISGLDGADVLRY